MNERPRIFHNPGETGGTPDRPLKYPRELVHRYGAKAGLLMYVAQELPDIPQMPMVVSEIGEPAEELLGRAALAGIGWPRFFRSSAVVELDGYEGDFPTEEVEAFEVGHERVSWNKNNFSLFRNQEYFDTYIQKLIGKIKVSPQGLAIQGKGNGLPDEINVIIVERSPSNYFGTYIKHPNQDDSYLIALTDSSTESFPRQSADNPSRSAFTYTSDNGVTQLKRYSIHSFDDPIVVENLTAVSKWHDRIAALPEMDPSWTYQIEFGIDPPMLYQVRPFKPVAKAGFRVKGNTDDGRDHPLVIGVTPPKGVVVRVERDPADRLRDDKPVNIDQQPSLLFEDLIYSRWLEDVTNGKVNIFYRAYGFLAHGDIKAMRHTDVTMLYPSLPFNLPLKQDDWVRVLSDGNNVRIVKDGKPTTV